jgi:hypothetical protein
MKALLSLVVALGVPAAFWNYYLREIPNVQYSLSTAIPLSIQAESKESRDKPFVSEYMQQIEVANSGGAEAKEIVVKISKPIIEHHLSKHVSNAVTEVSASSRTFEVIYKNLPPSTGFQITLKTNGAPLSEEQLQVFHQEGSAKLISPATSSAPLSVWGWIATLMPVLYLWFMYLNTRDEFRYQFLFKNYFIRDEKLLEKKRPWYIRQRDWASVLEDLISRALDRPIETYRSLSSTFPYKLLDTDKPDEIPQDQWQKLKETASSRLQNLAKLQSRETPTLGAILDLIRTPWPAGLSESDRSKISNDLSSIYVEKLLAASSPEDLLKVISENKKPEMVTDNAWERLMRSAGRAIANYLGAKIMEEGEVSLPTNSPAWFSLRYSEQDSLRKLQAGQIAAARAENKLKESLEHSEKTRALENQLRVRENKLEMEEERLSALSNKVVRQLDIIEKIIENPSYIDRIEPEDRTFAPGNVALLRNLAKSRK